MAQFAVPDADQAANSWTTTPLWSKVDEGTTGDDVLITSDAVANNTNTTNADLRLSNVTDPAVSTGHIIRARWLRDQSAARTMAGHCELWQGVPDTGSLIASLDIDPDVGTTEVEDTYTLSGAEADNITDYDDLYMRLWGRGTAGGPSRILSVEFCELETPDAPSGTTFFETLAVTAVGVAAVTRTTSKTLPATAIGVPAFEKTVSKTLAATATGVAAMAKGMFVTLAATAVGTAVLAALQIASISMAATAVGVASLTATPIFVRVLAATAIGVAAFEKTVSKTLAATATGTAALLKTAGKTLAATATGVATLGALQIASVTMAATAVGQASLDAVQLIVRALSATAVGVAGLATNFIAGGPGGAAINYILHWRRRRRGGSRG